MTDYIKGAVMDEIILLGCGGHAHSVIDSIEQGNMYHIAGFLNPEYEEYKGYSVIGSDNDMEKIFARGITNGHICVGYMGRGNGRERLFEQMKAAGYSLPVISDTSSTIALNTDIEEGVFVAKKSILNAGAHIGKCAIINSGSVIEHDCEIDAFCHVSPGAILCGNVKVGQSTHIGAGAVIRQGIRIGKHCIIGMGSIVLRDIPDYVIAYGNPCKIVGENQ